MGSLKDALEKAGFHQSKKFKENERPRIQKSEKKKIHVHQEMRDFCEVCDKVQPDVELYHHRNPTIPNARWICVQCADQNQIPDDCRESNQSEFSKKGTFKRFFGRTKRF